LAKTDFKSAEEYIATFPSDVRTILSTVRKIIRKAVPDAEEVISYQLPAFKVNGGWVLYFGGFKDHFSLSCPPPFTVFQVFKKELAPYAVSKSAIRFPLNRPVPTGLIAALAKFRAKEARERGNGGKPATKPTRKAPVKSATKRPATKKPTK
jgi:uncharacterized protein YdhG (YjbR/CyaY superfamily)